VGLAIPRLKGVVVLVARFMTVVMPGLGLFVLGGQLAVRLDDFLGLLVEELERLHQVPNHCKVKSPISVATPII
jgi:hypothetical protein